MAELTAPGWPRPVIGGRPIPWAVRPGEFSALDPGRRQQALDERLCQVCGCEFEGSVYLLVGGAPPRRQDLIVLSIDDAVLHLRCLRLALGSCPGLARVPDLRVYGTTAERVELYDLPDEGPRFGAPFEALVR